MESQLGFDKLYCYDLLITPYQCDCKAFIEGEVHNFRSSFLNIMPFGKTIKRLVESISMENGLDIGVIHINCFR